MEAALPHDLHLILHGGTVFLTLTSPASWYTFDLRDTNKHPITLAQRNFEPYVSAELTFTRQREGGKPWLPFVSIDARDRTIYDDVRPAGKNSEDTNGPSTCWPACTRRARSSGRFACTPAGTMA